MDYRVGKCSSCGARYKIPATFEGNKAKCKSCSGVVEVGPVQTPGSEPGAKPKAQPIPARKPAEKKERSGPSMKEKLKAQREAEAAAAKPAAKAEPKAERSTSRRASSPRRARAAAGGGDGGDEESKSASKRTSARASSRGGSRRRGRGADGDDGDEPRSRRGRPQQKKANPAMFIGAIALVAIVAFGAWKFMGPGDDVEAGNGTDVASNAASAEGAAETATEGVADEAGGETALDAPTDDEGSGETADATPEGGTEDGVEAPDDDKTAATEEPVKPEPKEKVYDPSTVDLSVFSFDKVEGTTDEEWADLKELAALVIDPEAGAAGNRARKSLIEAGKSAMPAVIGQMLTMDFSTEEGYRNGDICQKTLMEICNGTNLGWKYTTELKDQVFNKKAVLGWAKNWEKAEKDEAYWRKFAKIDKQEAPAEEPAVSEDDLDDLDDL